MVTFVLGLFYYQEKKKEKNHKTSETLKEVSNTHTTGSCLELVPGGRAIPTRARPVPSPVEFKETAQQNSGVLVLEEHMKGNSKKDKKHGTWQVRIAAILQERASAHTPTQGCARNVWGSRPRRHVRVRGWRIALCHVSLFHKPCGPLQLLLGTPSGSVLFGPAPRRHRSPLAGGNCSGKQASASVFLAGQENKDEGKPELERAGPRVGFEQRCRLAGPWG